MLKINNYKLISQIKENQRIVLIADIHYWEKYNEKILDNILKKMEVLKPTLICICGDIIDEFRFFDKKENEQKLLSFFNKLTNYATTLITLGSHDIFNLKKEQTNIKSSMSISYWHQLIKENNNKQLILLDNEIYETQSLVVIGYTPSRDYFINGEKKEILISELNTKIPKFNSQNKYTILMCHTPLNLNKDVLKEVRISSSVDLILSGHMHDGLVFPILKKVSTTRGFVSPQKTFFPKNARGKQEITVNQKKITLIITGGIMKFSHSAPNYFQKFNFLYNNDLDLIEINNNEKS